MDRRDWRATVQGGAKSQTEHVHEAQAPRTSEETFRGPRLQPPSEGSFMRDPNPELRRQAASKF